MAITDNLVSYWKLDGNSTDSVGSNTGTDTAITYSNANGIINNGAGFNGSSSQILIGTGLPYFAKTSPISFSFWVKTSVTIFQAIAFNENSSFSAQFQIYMGADASGVMEYAYSPANSGANQLVARSTSAYSGGVYTHCVITYDGSGTPGGVKFYRNGSLDTTISVTNTLSTSATNDSRTSAIGVRNQTSSGFFTGDLDEFAIWTKVLSSGEVTTLYGGGAGLQYPFSVTLVAAVGSFILTGINVSLAWNIATLITGIGSFILTGINVVLSVSGFHYPAKSSNNLSSPTKSTNTFSSPTKSSDIFTSPIKH